MLRRVTDLGVEVLEQLAAPVGGADGVDTVPDRVDPAMRVDDPAGPPRRLDALGRVQAEAEPIVHVVDLRHGLCRWWVTGCCQAGMACRRDAGEHGPGGRLVWKRGRLAAVGAIGTGARTCVRSGWRRRG